MLNFVLCDDNKIILQKIGKMLDSILAQHNFDGVISLLATSPKQVLEFMQGNIVNVVFLDIDFKDDMNGLQLAKEIRKQNKDIYIIFTSAHLEYILMAYKYKTFDFLPKPITIEKLEETIVRLFDDLNNSKKQNFFIRINNNNTIIDENTVFFIKRDGMKIVFYAEHRNYEIYSSFKKIEPVLPKNFVRCHKSFMVNAERISQFSNNVIVFDKPTKEKCYIGPKYKNNFMEVLKNYGNFTNNLDSSKFGE